MSRRPLPAGPLRYAMSAGACFERSRYWMTQARTARAAHDRRRVTESVEFARLWHRDYCAWRHLAVHS